MSQATILVVDDEPGVRAALRAGLESQGWTVLEAGNRDGLFERVERHHVSLITLDLRLGNEDGLEIAQALRATKNIPILMITRKTTPFDRAIGLESGADNYILKPFHIREVILRVRRTLELYQGDPQSTSSLVFDHSVLDTVRHMVSHLDGTTIALTPTELMLLEFFLRHPGRILACDEISQSLYGKNWTPLDRAIDGYVARFRRKIGSLDEDASMILSVRGVGSVFTGRVR